MAIRKDMAIHSRITLSVKGRSRNGHCAFYAARINDAIDGVLRIYETNWPIDRADFKWRASQTIHDKKIVRKADTLVKSRNIVHLNGNFHARFMICDSRITGP